MSDDRFPQEIRELIIDALPQETAVSGQKIDLRYTFTPAGHARALHPNYMLIVGIRGAGKSFWWTVLQEEKHREMVAHMMPGSGISGNTKVSVGFGERSSPNDYPGKDILKQLCKGFDPRQIWRTIVLFQVIKGSGKEKDLIGKSWLDKVHWLEEHPEETERLLFDADQKLDIEGIHHLVLFDALDRAADDWPTMLKIIRGLLQVLLEFRSYKRIRPKAFVRPDHLADTKTIEFPDSSKVLNEKVELRWPLHDLYGLLWQYLGNEPKRGEPFRDHCERVLGAMWAQFGSVWIVPDRLRNEENAQRSIFHTITGGWMGRDSRRGFPYTWLPHHLGDANGQVSPRSFLAALRHTALDTPRPDYKFPLYYESIKRGVQKASQIRVREMQEDYPWVELLMKPLAGLTVPCRFEDVASRWDKEKTLNSLDEVISKKEIKLPPARAQEGPDGIRRDLEALGVFERMTDDRVNLPDVYRVGYGLGRRGGVKAVART